MHQTIYYGGTILTMHTPKPEEALLVCDGIVTAVGTREQLFAAAPNAQRINLDGQTLMPAFLDAHSHFISSANAILQANLSECADFDELAARISRFAQSAAPGQWITASGYDHNTLSEGRHPTRALLDRAAPGHPVVAIHASGHVGVFNSAALALFGIDANTPAPQGGSFGIEDGQLTGYMEENAFLEYLQRVPMPSTETLMQACMRAQQQYASYGITTIQDGMVMEKIAPLLDTLAAHNRLFVDVVGYADVENAQKLHDLLSPYWNRYHNHFKMGGYKIFLDGSPQGCTAWMLSPYCGRGEYCGYPTHTDAQVFDALSFAVENGRQILAHCNGDAACEQLLRCGERIAAQGKNLAAIRPVIVHAQLITRDQLARAARLGFLPSFFCAHVYYWGDTHIQNFSAQRASDISPAADALALGLPFTFHQDAPVIPPNMFETVACAVRRLTRKGVVLGPHQRIRVFDALRAVTANAAYQYFEQQQKGMLLPGMRADMIRVDRNPLNCPAESLADIRVLETYKNGQSIYRA